MNGNSITIHDSRLTAHGIMFHHFHDESKHIKEQGSISSEELISLLDYYSETHNIISADEFLLRSQNNELLDSDVCLSFDDGLLCQYDVALPVLESRGIKAFWFIYTSPSEGIIEKLEVYRHFRFSKFADVEEFYEAFFRLASALSDKVNEVLKEFNPDEYAKDSPFYTPNDKRFRYLRDKVLGESLYTSIMDSMIREYNYDVAGNSEVLWLRREHIKDLYSRGHIIGLHSHTHNTLMASKPREWQMKEYAKNKECLEAITGGKVISASYPCNSYNSDTLEVMRELGIQLAFRANMSTETIEGSRLEYPREDHANIIRMMKGSI